MSGATRVIEQYLAAYNDGRFDDLRTLVAADYVHHNGALALDVDGFCRGAGWIRRGLPDFHVTLDDQLVDGSRVAIRFTGSGTHTGSFDGEPPTGARVTVYGTTIYRIEGGTIAEDWESLDEAPFRALLSGGSV
jgi:predicted ester cyclase